MRTEVLETSEDAVLGGRLRLRQPLKGHRVGHDAILLAAATGARFSLLPPENATGNYVKVVQRIPVKIVLDKGQDNRRDDANQEEAVKKIEAMPEGAEKAKALIQLIHSGVQVEA